MSCARPSSSSRKSFLVRSLTIAPFLLRTLANRLTTLTPVENVGLSCCWAPSNRSAGTSPRTENRLRREIGWSSAIGVLRDARNGGQVTAKAATRGAARDIHPAATVALGVRRRRGQTASIRGETDSRLAGGVDRFTVASKRQGGRIRLGKCTPSGTIG